MSDTEVIRKLAEELADRLGREFTFNGIYNSRDDDNKVSGSVFNIKLRYYNFRVKEPIYVQVRIHSDRRKYYPLDVRVGRTRREIAYWRKNDTFTPRYRFKYKQKFLFRDVEIVIRKLISSFLIMELDTFSKRSMNYINRMRW